MPAEGDTEPARGGEGGGTEAPPKGLVPYTSLLPFSLSLETTLYVL